MTRKTTVALVGDGVIATTHARALAQQGEFVVTALVDPSPDAGPKIAEVTGLGAGLRLV